VFSILVTTFLISHYIVGYSWASTILGILATIMGLFPFLFYKFGPRIRQGSRYAQELAQLEREERERLKFIEVQALKAANVAVDRDGGHR
jgi:hypothetical protein